MIAPNQEMIELQQTLRRVQRWSPDARQMLIQSVRSMSVAQPESATDDDRDVPTLDELEGILDNGTPPPTDEDVKRWLEEERMRKYG